MGRIDELRLLVKVAYLYYERGHKQPEIAEQIQLSQATVSRLLKRAYQEKIVRISVSSPRGVYPELEDAIQTRYRLKDVMIADCVTDNETEILRSIGSLAAFYLETTVTADEIVGISSWSKTLLSMVEAMQPLQKSYGAKIVQILGGIGNPGAESHATNLTRQLASYLRGEPFFLPAPGVVSSVEAKKLYYKDQFVCDAIDLMNHVTLALVGIGTVEPSEMLARSGNVFSSEELEGLRSLNAVGDICLRFFDKNGVPVITPLNERVIGMDLNQLKNTRRSVGIAGGQRKVVSIVGALKGGWINVLITDRLTAEGLLKEKV